MLEALLKWMLVHSDQELDELVDMYVLENDLDLEQRQQLARRLEDIGVIVPAPEETF